jgi:threonine aldolase
VCGTKVFIAEARRNRKVLGGGMRQAGIIAAAGIVALETMKERLSDDHANARRLAQGIHEISGLAVDLASVQTNILYVDLVSNSITVDDLIRRLENKGVKILSTGPARFRMVTHYGINVDDIDATIKAIRDVLAGAK